MDGHALLSHDKEEHLANLQRLRPYFRSVREVLAAASLKWWLTRFLWVVPACLLFTLHWILFAYDENLATAGGSLFPSSLVVSVMVPFMSSMMNPVSLRMGDCEWMVPLSARALGRGGCCGGGKNRWDLRAGDGSGPLLVDAMGGGGGGGSGSGSGGGGSGGLGRLGGLGGLGMAGASGRGAQSSINGGCAMGDEEDDSFAAPEDGDGEHGMGSARLGCGVLMLFPSLRAAGLLRRSGLFALQCAPAGFLCAWALMHVINFARACPTLYGRYTECVWNRGDSGLFLALHAMVFNMWVSVLSLAGYLLEGNLSPEDVARMVRAQHPEDFDDLSGALQQGERPSEGGQQPQRSGFLLVASYVA